MIGAIISLADGAVKLFNKIADALKTKKDQDDGRRLQRGDDAQAQIKEAQAVHDAQSDPAAVERVRQQSYRD